MVSQIRALKFLMVFAFSASLLGLYIGIGSRSCKAKRGEPRIAEETCMFFPFFVSVHSVLSITNYWLWQNTCLHSHWLYFGCYRQKSWKCRKIRCREVFFAISVFNLITTYFIRSSNIMKHHPYACTFQMLSKITSFS